MASSANNILISPANAFWRIEANSQFDFSGLTGADVKGKYFTLNSPSTSYYVWGDDSIEADPAPGGLTGIAFTVTGDADSDTTLATACQAAIDAEGDFDATVSGTVVDVKSASVGEVADPADVDSGVAVTLCRRGKDLDLGLIEGDSDLGFEPQLFDVISQQNGLTPAASLVQGFTAEPALVLQETVYSRVSEFYKIYGAERTPAAGTEITGVGTGTVGNNLLVDAARLSFQPVNTISAELSYDITYMLTAPIPSSLIFSGENPRTLSVSFKTYVDQSLDPRNNYLVIGDGFQDGL